MKDYSKSGRFLYGSYSFQQEIEWKETRENLRQEEFGEKK